MKKLTFLLPLIISVVGLSCGGGGGGGSSSANPSIPYSGISEPAVVTNNNAEELVLGAYLGWNLYGSSGGTVFLSTQENEVKPFPHLGISHDFKSLLEISTEFLETNSSNKAVPLVSIPVTDTVPGDCSGWVYINGTLDDGTGNFNLKADYDHYSDDCVTYATGDANMSGIMDLNYLEIVYMKLTYGEFTLSSNSSSMTISGTRSMDWRVYPWVETINIVTRDDATGKTYWMKDYTLHITTGSDASGDFDDMNVTGRYYDPDYGYVDISSPELMHFYWVDQWPSGGELKALGASSGKALLKCLSKASYMVEVDADADGAYEWNTGVLHWSETNTPPVANAGADKFTEVGIQVTLNGNASSDADGDILSFNWTILTKPASSTAALSDDTSMTPVFIPDVAGTYEFGLTVSDGFETSPMDSVILNVQAAPFIPLASLPYRVVDAEYSRQLDRIIMVSSGPNNLHIFDPITGSDTSISLPLTPNCVSISPDGMFAAVGHNAWVSYVNLDTATLVKSISVTTDVSDVVLAGNGYIYAFPRTDQWETIRCLNISTEVETLHTGRSVRAGTKVKLHPDGLSIYGANNGVSPSDIEKYDISSGTAQYLYDSPYHGDYSMAGNLWMSDDGLRIFTRSGNAFRASSIQSEDMTYNGSLSNLSLVQSLDHSSAAGKVIVIPEEPGYLGSGEDTELQIYDYDYLVYESNLVFPSFIVGSTSYSGHGRYAFFNSTGGNYFVILQADASSGLLNDYGVVGY